MNDLVHRVLRVPRVSHNYTYTFPSVSFPLSHPFAFHLRIRAVEDVHTANFHTRIKPIASVARARGGPKETERLHRRSTARHRHRHRDRLPSSRGGCILVVRLFSLPPPWHAIYSFLCVFCLLPHLLSVSRVSPIIHISGMKNSMEHFVLQIYISIINKYMYL